jgi:hypothetical protein
LILSVGSGGGWSETSSSLDWGRPGSVGNVARLTDRAQEGGRRVSPAVNNLGFHSWSRHLDLTSSAQAKWMRMSVGLLEGGRPGGACG